MKTAILFKFGKFCRCFARYVLTDFENLTLHSLQYSEIKHWYCSWIGEYGFNSSSRSLKSCCRSYVTLKLNLQINTEYWNRRINIREMFHKFFKYQPFWNDFEIKISRISLLVIRILDCVRRIVISWSTQVTRRWHTYCQSLEFFQRQNRN